MKIENYLGFFSRDNIDFRRLVLYETASTIINLDSEKGPGTHWVALKKVGNVLFWMDSAGGFPLQEIVDAPELKNMRKFSLTGRIQGKSTTCGFYALMFLKLVNKPEDLIELNLIFSSLSSTDDITNQRANESILRLMIEKTMLQQYDSDSRNHSGSGPIVDWLLKLPLPELHLPLRDAKTGKIRLASFCGPYTNMKKRMMPDGVTPRPFSKPVNDLDEACQYHDIGFVYDGPDKTAVRQAADKKLIAAAREFRKKSSNLYDKGSAFAVEKVIGSL